MTPMMLALVILAATIVLFIWEPIPIAVTAILSSLAYAYTGIVPVNTIFSSYDNQYPSCRNDGRRIISVSYRDY